MHFKLAAMQSLLHNVAPNNKPFVRWLSNHTEANRRHWFIL